MKSDMMSPRRASKFSVKPYAYEQLDSSNLENMSYEMSTLHHASDIEEEEEEEESVNRHTLKLPRNLSTSLFSLDDYTQDDFKPYSNIINKSKLLLNHNYTKAKKQS